MDNINPAYWQAKEKIMETMEEQGYVLLGNFFEPGVRAGLEDGLAWEDQAKMDLHKYEQAEGLQDMLETITRYIGEVYGKELEITWHALRRYSAGSFTLQHDEQPPAGIFITLFLANTWNPEFRGELTIVHEEPIKVMPQDNAVLVVQRTDENVFVKRITHKAEEESVVMLHAVLV